MIYVDNAATSFFKAPGIAEVLEEYLKNPGNPGRGTHPAAMDAARMVLDTRIKLADFFGCSFSRVIFTGGITESLNTVIRGLLCEKDHILTTFWEHNSVLRPLYRLGCELSVCDASVEEFRSRVRPNTKAVILNHVSNVTGEIHPLRDIGAFCRERGLLFIVDAAQSAGLLPISMEEDGIDILCFAGHKGLLGLPGIGGICLKEDIPVAPLKVGGSGVRSFDREHPSQYPSALEAGTLNVPGILSLNCALDYLKERGMESILAHERELAEEFCSRLVSCESVTIYRRPEKDYVGIAALNIRGKDAGWVSDQLSGRYGIETRAGAHCAPLVHRHYGTESMVRFSFGLNNTGADAAACARAVEELAGE